MIYLIHSIGGATLGIFSYIPRQCMLPVLLFTDTSYLVCVCLPFLTAFLPCGAAGDESNSIKVFGPSNSGGYTMSGTPTHELETKAATKAAAAGEVAGRKDADLQTAAAAAPEGEDLDMAAAKAGPSSSSLQGGGRNPNGHVNAVEAAAAGVEAGGDEGPVSFSLLCSVDKAHDLDVNCVAWHPQDPALLVSAGDDGVLKLWRFHTRLGSLG